jgi:hypothetical protein
MKEEIRLKRKESHTDLVKKVRHEQRTEDEEGFKATIAAQKSKERNAKKNTDELGFKAARRSEKTKERNQKRNIDEEEFKATIAAQKSKERNAKKTADEMGFKAARRSERTEERNQKRNVDEEGFKATIAAQKSKERNAKKNADEVGFKAVRRSERTKERNAKRNADEEGYKAGRTAEKTKERNLKRKIDEDGLRMTWKEEKDKERNVKRKLDEDGLRKTWKDEKSRQREKRTEDMKHEVIRRKMFFSSVREGPIYGCICCHRIKFRKGVVEFNETLIEKINQQNPNIIEKSIGIRESKFLVGNSFYVCEDCKRKLMKGKMPALSHKNKLDMVDISNMKELYLTELENCLIARNILFQKFVQLPKSRWTATKDQIVNIPIFDKDILNTLESFPRTPEEAGIIPVRLKRKMEYKNNHIEQYISTKKVFEALQTLKRLGNKYYQFVPDIESYKKRCQETDPDGFNFLFETSEKDETSKVNEFIETDELSDSDKEEQDCVLKDSARKWQFQYIAKKFSLLLPEKAKNQPTS